MVDCDVFFQHGARGGQAEGGDTDSTQPPEAFLRHVFEAHFDKLYDLPGKSSVGLSECKSKQEG